MARTTLAAVRVLLGDHIELGDVPLFSHIQTANAVVSSELGDSVLGDALLDTGSLHVLLARAHVEAAGGLAMAEPAELCTLTRCRVGIGRRKPRPGWENSISEVSR